VTGPLSGRRLLVTRRREQASALVDALRGLGAEVLEVPAIAIAPPEDAGPLDAALRDLGAYEWMAFASANAVFAVRDRLASLALDVSAFPRIASVGAATSRALASCFPDRPVALEPASDFRADGLLDAFAALDLTGRRVLLPTSDRGRAVLSAGLRARGALVDVVVAYRTIAPEGLDRTLAEALSGGIDAAVFASPSAVHGVAEALPEGATPPDAIVIGPTTEAAARAAGLAVLALAMPSTTDGLVDAVVRALSRGA
jgi:uroporphyrinogen-III synthase